MAGALVGWHVAADASTADSVPDVHAATTLTATYNDLDGVRELFKQHKGEIAGVILEPVVGNSGFIVPTQEFLQACSAAKQCEECRVMYHISA